MEFGIWDLGFEGRVPPRGITREARDPESTPLCNYQACTPDGVLFFVPLNPYKSKLLAGSWNKKPCNVPLQGLVLVVIAPGFEPGTVCLEGRCSIQLSYATLWRVAKLPVRPKRSEGGSYATGKFGRARPPKHAARAKAGQIYDYASLLPNFCIPKGTTPV